jgi:hypothetical protein
MGSPRGTSATTLRGQSALDLLVVSGMVLAQYATGDRSASKAGVKSEEQKKA